MSGPNEEESNVNVEIIVVISIMISIILTIVLTALYDIDGLIYIFICFCVVISLYLALSPVALSIYEAMREWAYQMKVHKSSKDERTLIASIWPVALPGGTSWYFLVGVARRLFL